MESERIKDIKKALEYNVLDELIIYMLPYADEFNKLKKVSLEDILTYINELEEANERLAEENSILKSNPPIITGRNAGKTIRAKLINYDKLKQLNKSLEDQLTKLERKCDCANIESYAVDQFAEKVKNKIKKLRKKYHEDCINGIGDEEYNGITEADIDNILR